MSFLFVRWFVGSLAVVLLLTASARAAPVVVPPGLQPGDTYHLIFATSTQVGTGFGTAGSTGSFGSVAAADWITNELAFTSGLLPGWNSSDLIYKALLSSDDEAAIDHIGISAPVYNTAGELVATGSADMWDGSLQNPVGYNEFGNPITDNPEVWTGTLPGGQKTSKTCINWTDPNTTTFGHIGVANASTASWVADNQIECSDANRLYGVSPVLTVVPEPSSVVLACVGFGLLVALRIRRRRRREGRR
jgi:hypothetical protein